MGDSPDQRIVEEEHLVRPYELFTGLHPYSQQSIRRNDAKTVSIVALGCFHPVVKVQSASLHFFLGSDDEQEDSEDEDEDVRFDTIYYSLAAIHPASQGPNAKTPQHRREINKKTRSGDRKLQKSLKAMKAVRPFH